MYVYWSVVSLHEQHYISCAGSSSIRAGQSLLSTLNQSPSTIHIIYDLAIKSNPTNHSRLDEADLWDLANTLNTMAAAENAKENWISGQAAAGNVRALKPANADMITNPTTTQPLVTLVTSGIVQLY